MDNLELPGTDVKSNKSEFQGNLTNAEWQEICSLDYVLTWGFSKNYESDLVRYKYLSSKRTANE